MKNRRSPSALTAFGLLLQVSQFSHAAPPTFLPLDEKTWLQQGIKASGKVIKAGLVSDAVGEHLLVLSEKSTTAKNGRVERYDLNASYYDRAANGWIVSWGIKDFVDCPGLDSTAAFFADATSISDIDQDGTAEVTVAYRMFCGGGIEPSTVKVILRQKDTKFAIRGESLIQLRGQPPFGGTSTPDKILLSPQNAAFKSHMQKIWHQVYIERRGDN
jgi:hypothetical protein